MLSVTCPSCGAKITFVSKVTVQAVCQYCNSTLVRHDVDIKHLGTMAVLQEDFSVLQIGTRGVFEGNQFQIVGRVEYQWERGKWTEWFLYFPDGTHPSGGWLAEAEGFYAVSTVQEWPANLESETLSGGGTLNAGDSVNINGTIYTVIDRKEAESSYGAGELPFVIEPGKKHIAMDLTAPGDWFGCIEKRDEELTLYLGRYGTFDQLKLENVRELDGWEP